MRRRTGREREQDALTVGERVWMLSGGALRVGEVHTVRIVLEGDPLEFRMYSVRLHDRTADSIQRNHLYRAPAERRELLDTLDSDRNLLAFYHEEIKAQDDDHVPEIGDEA